jgi:hypothetical protein
VPSTAASVVSLPSISVVFWTKVHLTSILVFLVAVSKVKPVTLVLSFLSFGLI